MESSVREVDRLSPSSEVTSTLPVALGHYPAAIGSFSPACGEPWRRGRASAVSGTRRLGLGRWYRSQTPPEASFRPSVSLAERQAVGRRVVHTTRPCALRSGTPRAITPTSATPQLLRWRDRVGGPRSRALLSGFPLTLAPPQRTAWSLDARPAWQARGSLRRPGYNPSRGGECPARAPV